MKIPEPYRRSGKGDTYYFTYDDAGRRRVKSTGETLKGKARDYIAGFMAQRDAQTDSLLVYSEPFFVHGACPREHRMRTEGRNFGTQHMAKSRYWLKTYIWPDVISDIPIGNIRRRDVLDFRARLMAKYPQKHNTVAKVVETLKAILSEAVYREDIPSNPGSGVAPPKYERKERAVFTASEVRGILANLPQLCATDKAKTWQNGTRPRMEALIATLLCTGMRLGEARAWRWQDIDFDARRFDVVQAVKDKSGTIGPPKWGKRRVGLRLPLILSQRLIAWRGEVPGYELVFPAPDDVPMSETVVRKAWTRVMDHAQRLGILAPDGRWLTPHSCRHTLNTHLIAERVPPLDTQLYMGWSSEIGKALTRVQQGYTDMRLLDTSTVADTVDRLYATGTRQARARGR